ncbi:MAG: 1-acyl-sn-glycerol-3-phosphate acyltransferase, partial [Spirochaetales bacterium]
MGLAQVSKPRHYIYMIRTIFFYTYFWVTLMLTSPLVLVYVILMLFGLHRPFKPAIGIFARAWARSVVWATGSRVTIEGAENVPATGGVCLIGNHQGSLEVPIILATLPRTPGFVAKSEALFTPFLNIWILALGGIFIDRHNAGKARHAIELGIKRLK